MHESTNSRYPRGLELALREALSRGRHYAGNEQILLGLDSDADNATDDTDRDACARGGDARFAVPGDLSDTELKDRIGQLSAREHAVSYERRMLHGEIDLLRAEQVNRLRQRYASTRSGRADA